MHHMKIHCHNTFGGTKFRDNLQKQPHRKPGNVEKTHYLSERQSKQPESIEIKETLFILQPCSNRVGLYVFPEISPKNDIQISYEIARPSRGKCASNSYSVLIERHGNE